MVSYYENQINNEKNKMILFHNKYKDEKLIIDKDHKDDLQRLKDSIETRVAHLQDELNRTNQYTI